MRRPSALVAVLCLLGSVVAPAGTASASAAVSPPAALGHSQVLEAWDGSSLNNPVLTSDGSRWAVAAVGGAQLRLIDGTAGTARTAQLEGAECSAFGVALGRVLTQCNRAGGGLLPAFVVRTDDGSAVQVLDEDPAVHNAVAIGRQWVVLAGPVGSGKPGYLFKRLDGTAIKEFSFSFTDPWPERPESVGDLDDPRAALRKRCGGPGALASDGRVGVVGSAGVLRLVRCSAAGQTLRTKRLATCHSPCGSVQLGSRWVAWASAGRVTVTDRDGRRVGTRTFDRARPRPNGPPSVQIAVTARRVFVVVRRSTSTLRQRFRLYSMTVRQHRAD
jgi:hypothetical protein